MNFRLRESICVCAHVIVLTILAVPSLSAQTGQAEITGEIRDQTGAAVSSAKITVKEIRTGQTSVASLSENGLYTLTRLKPGLYSITAEAPDFKRFVREGVLLATGERIRLDIVLTPGSITDSVTINADASLLRTETGSLGQVIGNRKIVDLPLNGRSFTQLISLAPGVTAPPGSAFPRVNGGRPRVNEYLFDGVSVLQPEPGQVAFFPVIDAIQEFKVETNSASAEFGRFNGGVINLTTKSGTNEFHGSAFEFFRNEALNARNLFAPATAANPNKPVFRRNQFGFVAGGPIVKNKTFFFGDYQATRQLIGRVRISTVPTLLQRQGIFTEPISGASPRIYDPATTRPGQSGGFVRDQFANNTIPGARIDSVARLLLDRFPMPTSSGTVNNYRRVGNETQNQDQFDVRIDHRFSGSDQVFVRFSYAKNLNDPVAPLPDGSGAITSGAIGKTDTIGQSLASNWIHTLNGRMANEFRFGYTRRVVDRVGLLLNAPPSESLKLPGIPSNAAFQSAMPTFTIDGLQQLGSPTSANSDFRTDVFHVFDSLAIQRGRHSIKVGLDFRWQRLDVIQPPAPTGQFRFSALFTDLPGSTGTGNALASFLLGQAQTFSIDLQQKALRPRAMIQEYFAQDDWKVNQRLTVNAGLRYTLNFPSTEVDDQGAIFNLQTQKLEYLGRDGFPRAARELHKLNFGPRLGLAYRVGDRTVIRAGFGVVWQEQAGITTPFTVPQFPFIQTVTQRNLDNITPAFTLANGPSVAPVTLTPDAGLGQGVFSVDRKLGSGYAQQWNLAVQRELTGNLTFEIAYAGSKITRVGIPDTNINQLTVEQLKLGATLLERVPNPFFGQIPRSSSLGDPTIPRAQLLKPFPRFTTVSLYRNNVGNTNFHALQMKLEKRFSRGLSFLVSYTRSKLIDEASSVFDATILTGPVANFPVADSFNRKLERGVSTGDIPNVFVASFTYDLPFGRGRLINPGGVIGAVIGGWEIAGLVNLQSGVPLAVRQATNFNAFAGFGVQRPNLAGEPELSSSQRSVARFFNTQAFAIAPQFTLGNSSRNPVRGPAYRNMDLALIKRAPIREQINLEFRAEFFNLTNTPPLGAPNIVIGTPGFGSITSAGDPRVVQMAVKVNF
ncbi:MAG: carboxypeptidase regulatory-like domain-containing protein [Blastocatellales bacterium]